MNRYGSATVTLPSDREILITRKFDAPARLVFEAWTSPEYVRRWWSGGRSQVVVCDIDLRVGGRWRYVTSDPDGRQAGWTGVYRDIVPPERLVSTEMFEGYPDAEALNTLTLTEHEGVTTLTAKVLHTSKENRDGHVNSGMEKGLQRTMDTLEDLLTAQRIAHAAPADGEDA